MNLLVTGGAGYIGSHAAIRLLDDGHHVTVVDNLCRGHMGAIDVLADAASVRRFEKAKPKAPKGSETKPANEQATGTIDLPRFHFARLDLNDANGLAWLMRDRAIEAVLHFGALAYVGESVEEPLRYYRSNAAGALSLLEAMSRAKVARLIFSSTCSTYGEPPAAEIPICETCPQAPINPYGRSKLMVEWMLRDHLDSCRRSGEQFACAALRYFNITGADGQGRLGEDHRPETHLVPICLEAAMGQRPHVALFGTDYATPDGTCIRDYVHVDDLIDAHVAALGALDPTKQQWRAYNVGIGRGYSVREVIEATQRVTGVKFAVQETDRRAGDPPTLYAAPQLIEREVGWQARRRDLEEIIATAWCWKQVNPDGYRKNPS